MKKYNECTSGKFIREAMNEINKAPLGTCPAPCYNDIKLAVQQCENERLSAQMSGLETGWEHPNTQTMWRRIVAMVKIK